MRSSEEQAVHRCVTRFVAARSKPGIANVPESTPLGLNHGFEFLELTGLGVYLRFDLPSTLAAALVMRTQRCRWRVHPPKHQLARSPLEFTQHRPRVFQTMCEQPEWPHSPAHPHPHRTLLSTRNDLVLEMQRTHASFLKQKHGLGESRHHVIRIRASWISTRKLCRCSRHLTLTAP